MVITACICFENGKSLIRALSSVEASKWRGTVSVMFVWSALLGHVGREHVG